jgi:beta-hydroxylase
MPQSRTPLGVLARPQNLAPVLFAASALALHLRGKARLAPVRQLTDHSTFTAPYNVLIYAASKVPASPYLDLESFPELQAIAARWREIAQEGRRLLEAGAVTAATGANDLGFHTFFKRGWTRFYLHWYGETPPSARQSCPVTTAILKAAPSIKGAMFAFLPPGASLGRHRDPFAGSLRFHLGLDTPNDDACWIEVDGERHSWRDGEGLLFDETYVHEARNNTSRGRLILLADVERPLRAPMRQVNRLVMRTVMNATATQNVEGEHIGVLNLAFGPIHALLQFGKRLKAKNRRLYYAIKQGLAAALALGVVASLLRAPPMQRSPSSGR